MFRKLQLSFGRLQVSRSPFRRFVEVPRQVEIEVREFAASPAGARELSNLLDTWHESAERVARRTMEALACGELEYVAWSAGGGSSSGTTQPVRLASLLADDDDAEEIPLHAVVIALVNDQDQPVAGAAYRLIDPAGRTHSGSLDDEGRAEIRQIRKPGKCRVSFPGYDTEAWSYIHAQPL